METGTYLLVLNRPGNYIIDDMELMGSAPCGVFYTLTDAQACKIRMEKETVFEVSIVQIIS